MDLVFKLLPILLVASALLATVLVLPLLVQHLPTPPARAKHAAAERLNGSAAPSSTQQHCLNHSMCQSCNLTYAGGAASGASAAAAVPPAPFSHAALLRSLDLALGREHGPRFYIYPPYDGPHPWANVSRHDCFTDPKPGIYGTPLWEQHLVQQLPLISNVVDDPAQADFLLIGHNAQCYHTQQAKETKGDFNAAFPVVFKSYLKPYLEQVRAGQHWRATNGANHMIGFAVDHGVCSWPSELYELLGDAVVLQANGYYAGGRSAQAAYMQYPRPCYNASTYVVVPPFIVWDKRRQPYPTHVKPIHNRTMFATFRGTIYPDVLEHSLGTRQLLLTLHRSIKPGHHLHGLVSVNRNAHYTQPGELIHEYNTSIFSLCPGGWGSWTPRPFVAMPHGALPVIMADGFVAPFEQLLPWRRFVHKLLAASTALTYQVLEGDIHGRKDELAARQALAMRLVPHLLWTGDEPRRAAAAMLVLELACRFVWPRHPQGPPSGVFCGHGEPPIGVEGWTAADVPVLNVPWE